MSILDKDDLTEIVGGMLHSGILPSEKLRNGLGIAYGNHDEVYDLIVILYCQKMGLDLDPYTGEKVN